MELKYVDDIAIKLKINKKGVTAALSLLGQGDTIPFISRYRKEATGNLDETQIMEIKKESERLAEFDSRKETILKEIEKQGRLTEELRQTIEDAQTISTLEDIYLPYKPKRKTKASAAKEMGLEPLAEKIFSQVDFNLEEEALNYLNEKVETAQKALEGAGYIIAEWINENKAVRESIRVLFEKEAVVISKSFKDMEEEGAKYRDYFDFTETLKTISSHRFLAIKRAEKEKILLVSIIPDENDAIKIIEKIIVKAANQAGEAVRDAVKDCYKRLLQPSMETEISSAAKEKADAEAIRVFEDNLRQLLLAPYLGRKRILALDPGFRTGCKVVCLNEQGDLLFNDTIYPHPPLNKTEESEKKLKNLVKKYDIEVIASGNGTAGRETVNFVNSVFKDSSIKVFSVSESGASVYSASDAAREEFPDYDVTVRGAVSIGRRLMDPLAELVKIDPKSIGVGQYQHDVDQTKLKAGLDFTVESCVNLVGVNVNTASRHLLTYVSGLGPKTAQNIIEYRKEKGAFKSRKELKKVPKLGEKAFEQCAGFLRIPEGDNPLDSSAVHPESYYIVEKIAKSLKTEIKDLIGLEIKNKINLSDYIDEKTGLPTLEDILKELAKPGRDPRQTVDDFQFRKDVSKMDDLKIGMVLSGIINNITNFGAFVDIGIKESGLIHISEMSHKFIKSPHEAVKLNQRVNAKIIDIDKERKRISLSLKGLD